MAMKVYVGLCRSMYGGVWLCRAMYGYVGLCRAIYTICTSIYTSSSN